MPLKKTILLLFSCFLIHIWAKTVRLISGGPETCFDVACDPCDCHALSAAANATVLGDVVQITTNYTLQSGYDTFYIDQYELAPMEIGGTAWSYPYFSIDCNNMDIPRLRYTAVFGINACPDGHPNCDKNPRPLYIHHLIIHNCLNGRGVYLRRYGNVNMTDMYFQNLSVNITGGLFNSEGGGVFVNIVDEQFTIDRCHFENLRVVHNGGAVANGMLASIRGMPYTIRNSTFLHCYSYDEQDSSWNAGGAVYLEEVEATLEDNWFEGCYVEGGKGGAAVDLESLYSPSFVRGNVFQGNGNVGSGVNTAYSDGVLRVYHAFVNAPGCPLYDGADIFIEHNYFRYNNASATAPLRLIEIHNNACFKFVVRNNYFEQNIGKYSGGIYASEQDKPMLVLENNEFFDNLCTATNCSTSLFLEGFTTFLSGNDLTRETLQLDKPRIYIQGTIGNTTFNHDNYMCLSGATLSTAAIECASVGYDTLLISGYNYFNGPPLGCGLCTGDGCGNICNATGPPTQAPTAGPCLPTNTICTYSRECCAGLCCLPSGQSYKCKTIAAGCITEVPTTSPTRRPTFSPSPALIPTESQAPSLGPTPGTVPTVSPSLAPTASPLPPTLSPSLNPSVSPSPAPTFAPLPHLPLPLCCACDYCLMTSVIWIFDPTQTTTGNDCIQINRGVTITSNIDLRGGDNCLINYGTIAADILGAGGNDCVFNVGVIDHGSFIGDTGSDCYLNGAPGFEATIKGASLQVMFEGNQATDVFGQFGSLNVTSGGTQFTVDGGQVTDYYYNFGLTNESSKLNLVNFENDLYHDGNLACVCDPSTTVSPTVSPTPYPSTSPTLSPTRSPQLSPTVLPTQSPLPYTPQCAFWTEYKTESYDQHYREWNRHVGLGDINGDGYVDAMFCKGFGAPYAGYRFGDGTGRFGASQYLSGGGCQASPRALDVNNDSIVDILVLGFNVIWAQGLPSPPGTFAATEQLVTTTGSVPKTLVPLDANLDGDIDLVVISSTGSTPYIDYFENKGNGSFSPAIPLDASGVDEPSMALVGDLTGDGYEDIVFTRNRNQERATFYRNNRGSGADSGSNPFVFHSVISNSSGSYVNAGVLFDVNGDARLDCILGCNTPTQDYYAFLNLDNNGTFSGPTFVGHKTLDRGSTANGMRIYGADVNQDGQVDLVTSYGDIEFTYLSNNASIGQTADVATANWRSVPSTGSGNTFHGGAMADLNGDGFKDLVMITGGMEEFVTALYSPVTDNFEPENITVEGKNPAYSVKTAVLLDLSGGAADQQPALVIGGGGGAMMFARPNATSFEPYKNATVLEEERGVCALGLGDVNGDGFEDLIMARQVPVSSLCDLYLYINVNGTSLAERVLLYPSFCDGDIIVEDVVDQDGYADIVCFSYNEFFVLKSLGGNGSFETDYLSFSSPTTRDYCWGDLDGDGDVDVAAITPFALYWHENLDNFQNFSLSRIIDDSYVESGIFCAAGDIDHDGKSDICIHDDGPSPYTNGSISCYFNISTSGASKVVNVIGSGLQRKYNGNFLYLVDMDNDGDVDLAYERFFDNIKIINNENGTFNGSEAQDTGISIPGFYEPVVQDLDGDGDMDFIAFRQSSGYKDIVSFVVNSCAYPMAAPTAAPTLVPSSAPTPTLAPTASPVLLLPTLAPTPSPTQFPSKAPTQFPSLSPTASPTLFPSAAPSKSPTLYPSTAPTQFPSKAPTMFPSLSPSASPTQVPSKAPTQFPSKSPTQFPSMAPTLLPTRSPVTLGSPCGSAPTQGCTLSCECTPADAPCHPGSPCDDPTCFVLNSAHVSGDFTMATTCLHVTSTGIVSSGKIVGTAGNDCIIVEGNVGGAVEGGDGADVIFINAIVSGVVDGGAGDDIILLNSAAGVSAVFGGAEMDRIDVCDSTVQVTMDGGLSDGDCVAVEMHVSSGIVVSGGDGAGDKCNSLGGPPTDASCEEYVCAPTASPTKSTTSSPTLYPSKAPTRVPSKAPTQFPSAAPSSSPTLVPSKAPTQIPSKTPTQFPSLAPTESPTQFPSSAPTGFPSKAPTTFPSKSPTQYPSVSPTTSPLIPGSPTSSPVTPPPSVVPSPSPTMLPSASPTEFPSLSPTLAPSRPPTYTPSLSPTLSPLAIGIPTSSPTTIQPSLAPTSSPTATTTAPTVSPTFSPTIDPCGNGKIDEGEECDGGGVCCGNDCKWRLGYVCRNSTGLCDQEDVCVAGNTDCVDIKEPQSVVCRSAMDICDVPEVCNGSSSFCPVDTVRPDTYVCLGVLSENDCDIEERCDGFNVTCPVDMVMDSTVVCRQQVAGAACDIEDYCPGNSASAAVKKKCGADARRPASFVCRVKAIGALCDAEEKCEGPGGSVYCPPDVNVTTGTVCDDGDMCTGYSSASDDRCSSLGVCGGPWQFCECNSDVDCAQPGEPCATHTCDPTTKQCESAPSPATVLCRASLGACDQPEYCTGVDLTCPADELLPNTVVCRSKADECDVSEKCNGASKVCPDDLLRPSGTECYAATPGFECDAPEVCNGTSAACPTPANGGIDVVLPDGHVCRLANPLSNGCDMVERCDGTSKMCPADAAEPNGRSCSDGLECTNLDQCRNKRCFGIFFCECQSDEQCNDGNVCTRDYCDVDRTGRCVIEAGGDLLNTACDDLFECTENDRCGADGLCSGTLSIEGDLYCPSGCSVHGQCCGSSCQCVDVGYAGYACDIKVDVRGSYFDWCPGYSENCIVYRFGDFIDTLQGQTAAIIDHKSVYLGVIASSGTSLAGSKFGLGVNSSALHFGGDDELRLNAAPSAVKESVYFTFPYVSSPRLLGVRLAGLNDGDVVTFKSFLGKLLLLDESTQLEYKLFNQLRLNSSDSVDVSLKRQLYMNAPSRLNVQVIEAVEIEESLVTVPVVSGVVDFRSVNITGDFAVISYESGGVGAVEIVEMTVYEPTTKQIALLNDDAETVLQRSGGAGLDESYMDIVMIIIGAVVCLSLSLVVIIGVLIRRTRRSASIDSDLSSSTSSLSGDEENVVDQNNVDLVNLGNLNDESTSTTTLYLARGGAGYSFFSTESITTYSEVGTYASFDSDVKSDYRLPPVNGGKGTYANFDSDVKSDYRLPPVNGGKKRAEVTTSRSVVPVNSATVDSTSNRGDGLATEYQLPPVIPASKALVGSDISELRNAKKLYQKVKPVASDLAQVLTQISLLFDKLKTFSCEIYSVSSDKPMDKINNDDLPPLSNVSAVLEALQNGHRVLTKTSMEDASYQDLDLVGSTHGLLQVASVERLGTDNGYSTLVLKRRSAGYCESPLSSEYNTMPPRPPNELADETLFGSALQAAAYNDTSLVEKDIIDGVKGSVLNATAYGETSLVNPAGEGDNLIGSALKSKAYWSTSSITDGNIRVTQTEVADSIANTLLTTYKDEIFYEKATEDNNNNNNNNEFVVIENIRNSLRRLLSRGQLPFINSTETGEFTEVKLINDDDIQLTSNYIQFVKESVEATLTAKKSICATITSNRNSKSNYNDKNISKANENPSKTVIDLQKENADGGQYAALHKEIEREESLRRRRIELQSTHKSEYDRSTATNNSDNKALSNVALDSKDKDNNDDGIELVRLSPKRRREQRGSRRLNSYWRKSTAADPGLSQTTQEHTLQALQWTLKAEREEGELSKGALVNVKEEAEAVIDVGRRTHAVSSSSVGSDGGADARLDQIKIDSETKRQRRRSRRANSKWRQSTAADPGVSDETKQKTLRGLQWTVAVTADEIHGTTDVHQADKRSSNQNRRSIASSIDVHSSFTHNAHLSTPLGNTRVAQSDNSYLALSPRYMPNKSPSSPRGRAMRSPRAGAARSPRARSPRARSSKLSSNLHLSKEH